MARRRRVSDGKLVTNRASSLHLIMIQTKLSSGSVLHQIDFNRGA
jgi:hypothetical protein